MKSGRRKEGEGGEGISKTEKATGQREREERRVRRQGRGQAEGSMKQRSRLC